MFIQGKENGTPTIMDGSSSAKSGLFFHGHQLALPRPAALAFAKNCRKMTGLTCCAPQTSKRFPTPALPPRVLQEARYNTVFGRIGAVKGHKPCRRRSQTPIYLSRGGGHFVTP